jgi:hypothetical protein
MTRFLRSTRRIYKNISISRIKGMPTASVMVNVVEIEFGDPDSLKKVPLSGADQKGWRGTARGAMVSKLGLCVLQEVSGLASGSLLVTGVVLL